MKELLENETLVRVDRFRSVEGRFPVMTLLSMYLFGDDQRTGEVKRDMVI